jgi:hypothetical protein
MPRRPARASRGKLVEKPRAVCVAQYAWRGLGPRVARRDDQRQVAMEARPPAAGEMWCKREPSFVENHMSRDNDTTSFKFRAMVATMIRKITKKYTCGRAMRQFMGHGGRKVWIADTSQTYL